MLTLRPIVAFWVAVGIATAYAGAFIFLPSVGVSLNMISTFAFLLVLGIVVDDAIVVGEGVHYGIAPHRRRAVAPSVAGAQLVAKPVDLRRTDHHHRVPAVAVPESGSTSEFTKPHHLGGDPGAGVLPDRIAVDPALRTCATG